MTDMGVTVAIIEADAVLLTLREDFEVWCLPGGGVDDGESLADAARREIREEIGLEVELTRLVGCYSRVGWRNQHVFMFAARPSGGTLAPDPREVLDARFFPFAKLPDPLFFGLESRLGDVISGVTGIVKTETIAVADRPSLSRSEIYALRDQSGLSRSEFYRRYIPLVRTDQAKTELAGCRPPAPDATL